MENEAVTRLFLKYIVVLMMVYFSLKTKYVRCNTPDASQEGALKSFKNYKDITIFHYIVPKETIRATWQFAAFMNNPACIPRKVNIYLQQGSFPIIVEQNYSFPANFNVSRDNQYFITTETAFETKSMVILPVYSPLPGDWFVGAYLSYWDQQIHQQGLSHKCQYSLGSVATWNRASNVQNIPIGSTMQVKTAARESYYKIYIGSNVWTFRVNVWDCKLTLKKFRNSTICIQSMTLKGRTMPNYTNPGAVLSLATNESYTFNELAPFEDSYYYLMIVSESIIEFNIQVSTTECSVRNAEITKRLKDTSKPSVAMNNTLQHEYNYYDNSEQLLESNTNFGDNDMSSDNEKCMPRFQLYRIEHTQSFSRDYIFKDNNQLFLSDILPTILQFNILPLTDIGGTLSVDINFNPNKRYSQFKQLVVIDACLNNGHLFKRRNERILCDSGFSMQISSNQKNNDLLIPYPLADTWYLSLEAKCYLNRFNLILPIVCDDKEIPIIVNIQLRQCTYAGNYSCGLNGYCHNLQQGLLYYSSCECFGGTKGWACDDDANVSFKSSVWFMTLILTTSNIFFLPAIYIAWKRRFYAETFIYFSTMLFSTLYHACDQNLTSYCVAKYDVLQYLDFFSSTLAFWVTLVAMAEIQIHLVPLAHMIGVIIIAYGVQSDKTGLYNVVLLFVLGLIMNVYSFIKYYCLNMKTWKHSKRFCNFIIGLILVTLGMTFYCIIETEANYYYMHSAWHITIAVSLIFLLPPSVPSQQDIIVANNSLKSFATNDNVDRQLDSTKNVNNVQLLYLNDPSTRCTTVQANTNRRNKIAIQNI